MTSSSSPHVSLSQPLMSSAMSPPLMKVETSQVMVNWGETVLGMDSFKRNKS